MYLSASLSLMFTNYGINVRISITTNHFGLIALYVGIMNNLYS